MPATTYSTARPVGAAALAERDVLDALAAEAEPLLLAGAVLDGDAPLARGVEATDLDPDADPDAELSVGTADDTLGRPVERESGTEAESVMEAEAESVAVEDTSAVEDRSVAELSA